MTDRTGLEGRFVRLLPMTHAHLGGLLEAATEDRSTFGFTPVPLDRATMDTYITTALQHATLGEQQPYVTWSVGAGRIVGSTRFYDLASWDWSGHLPESAPPARRPGALDVASIGYTWLTPSAQRTPVNTEAKVLMLAHAFEVLEVRAVRIQTDARNIRSRAAIERLGCSLDGVIRADRPGADGTVRDSAVYSMLADEWPAHHERLRERLEHTAEPR